MLVATDVELRAGARLLVSGASFQVGPGDKVGLVGRNGAGKTTLARVLAGEALPAAGTIRRSGDVGYLPQDPRTGDLDVLAMDRILSGRGLDEVLAAMRAAQEQMAAGDGQRGAEPPGNVSSAAPPAALRAGRSIAAGGGEPGRGGSGAAQGAAQGTERRPARRASVDAAIREYARLEDRLHVMGGYAAEAEAASMAASLGLPDRVLSQPLRTLSGGQRRRVELARILYGAAEQQALILDEPTNHLDADSVAWLRDFLRARRGGLMVISHDTALIEIVVNKVFHLDANRCALDVYNMGWRAYLAARETDDRRRRRERVNAERQAAALQAQADKMRYKATKARAAQGMERRAQRLLAGVAPERAADRVARLRFPTPAPCGRVPLTAAGLSKSYGSLEVFTGLDLAVDRGSRVVVLGLNGAGKTTLLRLLAGLEPPDTGEVRAGHGLRIGYYAQEHETLEPSRTVLDHIRSAAPDLPEQEQRRILGSFLFSGDDTGKPAGVLSGGEKTRLALAVLVVSGANVLLLDEPTNNLDPASRAEVLSALRSYRGAIVLVTHDEEAVEALAPERVLLLPDGVEDVWDPAFADLVALA